MGRSSRLAIGAIAAAVAAGQLAPGHLGAADLARSWRRSCSSARHGRACASAALVPVAIGAALIAVRLAVTAGGVRRRSMRPPDGTRTVALDGRGDRIATGRPAGRDARDDDPAPTGRSASPPRSHATRRSSRETGSSSTAASGLAPTRRTAHYLERIGAVGTLAARTLDVEPAPDDLARRSSRSGEAPASALTRVLPEPEAGLAAGHPHRPARPGRPRPRGGLHDGRRQPCGRDLGLEHRDRRRRDRGLDRSAGPASPIGRDDRRDRRLCGVRRCVGVGRSGGSSWPASCCSRARRAGQGGRRPRSAGPRCSSSSPTRAHRRRGVPALVARDRRAHRVGDATHRADRAAGRRPRPAWLAESLGVSLAAQAATLPIVLVSFGRLAVLSPLVNLVVVPLVAPAMAAGLVAMAGGALVALPARPPVVGAVIAAPGWVILRILVAVVETAAGLPFASVTLAPPFDLIAAIAAAAGILGVSWWARRPTAAPKTDASRATDRPGPRRPTRADSPAGRAAVAGLLVSRRRRRGRRRRATSRRSATISILDVGQGDAILVEGSRGGRLLIDGGPDPDRLLVELDRRIPPWDRRIDAVVLTPPARGPRRRAGFAARALPRGPRLRARDARTRSRLRGLAARPRPHRARRSASASPPVTA